jgi:transcription initiation factor TFIID TATA-box-binding protein
MKGYNYNNEKHSSKENQNSFFEKELSFDPMAFNNSPLIKELSFNLRSSKNPSSKEPSFCNSLFSNNKYIDKLMNKNYESSFISFHNNSFNDMPTTPQMNISFNNIDIDDDKNSNLLHENKNNEKKLSKEKKEKSKEHEKDAKSKTSFDENNPNTFKKPIKNKTPDSNEKIQHEKIAPSITNIVAIANLHSIIDIRKIASLCKNIEFDTTKNFLKMDLKNSSTKALIFSSGKMRVTGVNYKEQLKKALKSYKNIIKKCGYPSVKINMKEIKYVMFTGTCNIKYKLSFEKLKEHLHDFDEKIIFKQMTKKRKFPAVIYKKKANNSNLTLTIFHSGIINITGAKKEEDIYEEINRIYPVLLKCKI